VGLSESNPHHTRVTGKFFPTLEQLEEFYSTLKNLNQKASYRFWSKTQQIKFKESLNILKRRRRLFPCYAGLVEAVVYHTGEVGLCEYTPPIGNLRDTAFDFNRLWYSAEANRLRQSIQSCACIHGCNLLTSLGYDDKSVAAILSPND
jgi:MoaA/NifB/PqqE/SkfB family radical SAM enzyme